MCQYGDEGVCGCVSMVMRVCVWMCQYGDEGVCGCVSVVMRVCVGVSVW